MSGPANRRRLHLPPARHVAFVAAGGAVGGLLRTAVTAAWTAPPGAFPTSTLLENLVGALLLGGLLALLTERVVDSPWAKPLLATGVLGAFTTFATVSFELAQLLLHGSPGVAAAYATATVTGGLCAAAAGIATVRALLRIRRQGRR